MFLWLAVAPLMTGCLYHGWMHRPSSIVTRMKRELIWGDIVSGAIIAAIVIVSFLSLMSFADFLRGHWHPQRGEAGGRNQRRDGPGGLGGDNNEAPKEEDPVVDESVLKLLEDRNPLMTSTGDSSQEPIIDTTAASTDSEGFYLIGDEGGDRVPREDSHDQAVRGQPREERPEDEIVDRNAMDDEMVFDVQHAPNQNPEQNPRQNEIPFDPLDPGIPDDQVVSLSWCDVNTSQIFLSHFSGYGD